MIDRSHKLSIRRQVELLNISRGALYYQPKPVSESDLAVMNAIDRLHLDYPFMGSTQLCRQLRVQGLQVGRLHVRTLMRKIGNSAVAPQPGTSQRNPQHKVFPYPVAQVDHQPQQSSLGTGHHLYTHAKGFCLPDRGCRCLQPPNPGAPYGNHAGERACGAGAG